VQRPVYETAERDELNNGLRAGNEATNCNTPGFGHLSIRTGDHPTVARVIARKVPVQTVRYVEEQQSRKVPIENGPAMSKSGRCAKVARAVDSITWKSGKHARFRPENHPLRPTKSKCGKVPTQVVRMVEEEVVRKVPISTVVWP